MEPINQGGALLVTTTMSWGELPLLLWMLEVGCWMVDVVINNLLGEDQGTITPVDGGT